MNTRLFAVIAAILFAFGACTEKVVDPAVPEREITEAEPPTNIKVSEVDGQVVVRWTDNSSDEAWFSLWARNSQADEPRHLTDVNENDTTCVITRYLERGNRYYIGVCAEGIEGWSLSSVTMWSAAFEYAALEPDEPDPAPADTLPAVAFCADPVCTYASVAFKYAFENIENVKKLTYGLCWSENPDPTTSDKSIAGATQRRGYDYVLQAVPSPYLEPGVEYHFRAWLKADLKTYYSDDVAVSLENAPSAITLDWREITPSSFPASVKVYSTSTPLGGDNFNAWYAVADPADIDLRVNLDQGHLYTLEEQYARDAEGDKALVLVNGGYFYGTDAVGMSIVEGVQRTYLEQVAGSLRTSSGYAISAENSERYDVTRGCFGVDYDGVPAVFWSHRTFFYSCPLPVIVGEARYSDPLKAVKADWKPRYAVGAGPVLLYDGKVPFDFTLTGRGPEYYLNNFELIPYDIFAPDASPDRTAVGITDDGKIVLFVCDGRITASTGATMTELARIMLGLGCRYALNLDGGGSTAMAVAGQRVNSTVSSTSGATDNRPVATNLGLYIKK